MATSTSDSLPALGICLEEYSYPYPVGFLPVISDLKSLKRAAHFHLWLVPKKDIGDLRGVDYMAQRPPLTTSISEAAAMAEKIRTEFDRPQPS